MLPERRKQLNASLLSAATCGDVAALRAALDAGADSDCRSESGRCDTALSVSAGRGHLECMTLLLERGANVLAAGGDGGSPLHRAAMRGHAACVRALLSHGASVDQVDKTGDTPLSRAALSGHVKCLCVLLQFGASVNRSMKLRVDDGGDFYVGCDTPLHHACSNGHVDCVRLLVEHQAAVNVRNSSGCTPLAHAVSLYGGHRTADSCLGCVRLLLQSGADVRRADIDGNTALHWSAKQRGTPAFAFLLLNAGAPIDAVNRQGWTALHFATLHGRLDYVRLLLERGAAVDVETRTGETALTKAIEGGHIECMRLLVEHGANLDHVCGTGSTPLHLCAIAGSPEGTRLLLLYGASTEATTSDDDSTPLHRAVANGRPRTTSVLLEHGADTEAEDDGGQTPLELAAENRQLSCAVRLLAHRAVVSLECGNVLWNDAVELAHRDLVFWLLLRGVPRPAAELAAAGVEDDEGDDSDEEADAAAEDQDGAAPAVESRDKAVVARLLVEWPQGALRLWRPAVHQMYPSAFRADVAATLLATLGSLDAGDTAVSSHVIVPRRASKRLRGIAPGADADVTVDGDNPLRLLQEQQVLDVVVRALLKLHVGAL